MPVETKNSIRAVAVYCGSSSGERPEYLAAAVALGHALADRGIDLVYGGGRVGLMGAVADATLVAGGRVHGIITRALFAAEIAHGGLTSLEVVDSMHERKLAMAARADGFVALPGGFGTWDELCEVLTWTQLGIHAKPTVVVNVLGFWDGLLAMAVRATTDGFVKPVHRDLLREAPTAVEALDRLLERVPPPQPKWIDELPKPGP